MDAHSVILICEEDYDDAPPAAGGYLFAWTSTLADFLRNNGIGPDADLNAGGLDPDEAQILLDTPLYQTTAYKFGGHVVCRIVKVAGTDMVTVVGATAPIDTGICLPAAQTNGIEQALQESADEHGWVRLLVHSPDKTDPVVDRYIWLWRENPAASPPTIQCFIELPGDEAGNFYYTDGDQVVIGWIDGAGPQARLQAPHFKWPITLSHGWWLAVDHAPGPISILEWAKLVLATTELEEWVYRVAREKQRQHRK